MSEPQNISAAGTTTASISVSPAAKPRASVSPAANKPRAEDVKVQESASLPAIDETGVRDEATGKTQPAETKPEPAPQKGPTARIGYSFEEREPYIEILNPRTGDVIRRFPAEAAEDELRTFTDGDSGVFIDRVA